MKHVHDKGLTRRTFLQLSGGAMAAAAVSQLRFSSVGAPSTERSLCFYDCAMLQDSGLIERLLDRPDQRFTFFVTRTDVQSLTSAVSLLVGAGHELAFRPKTRRWQTEYNDWRSVAGGAAWATMRRPTVNFGRFCETQTMTLAHWTQPDKLEPDAFRPTLLPLTALAQLTPNRHVRFVSLSKFMNQTRLAQYAVALPSPARGSLI